MLPPALMQENDKIDENTLNHNINNALTKNGEQQEETTKQRRAQEEASL